VRVIRAQFVPNSAVLLADPDNELILNAASILDRVEPARRKIDMPEAFVQQASGQALALDRDRFRSVHRRRDPFDRMIIATALVEDLPLISGDSQFASYKGLGRGSLHTVPIVPIPRN
jgi:PIN domain nuclease of toxin-antitoxin system